MNRGTIIRWRLINETTRKKKIHTKRALGAVHTRTAGAGKIDRYKIPGREQNKSALGSLLKSSMM